MTMLKIFKSRLPEGMEVVKATKRGSTYKLDITYGGEKRKVELRTTCVPGKENFICDYTIFSALMSIERKKGNKEEVEKWYDKITELVDANSEY